MMKVKINDYEFEIIEKGNSDEVYIKGEEMRIGLCDYVNQKIYIHSSLTPALKRKTLAHELTHACLFAHGLAGFFKNEELLCDFAAIYAPIIGRNYKETEKLECDIEIEFRGKQ